MAEIDIKINGIAQIKKELRELKGELAAATDPTQMAELAAKAGELSDQLKDANERVSVFASGSPFEQTNNALGLMGSQLMSLDFEGAAESSKLFASAAKGINGDVIAKSLKGLGTVVGQVGKAFMSVGLSLLTNPIFLIAAAITAIVTIIVLLMKKLGILEPILNSIGEVFGWLMDIVDAIVESFKMLTDWIGLSDFAGQKRTEETIKGLQEERAAMQMVAHQIDNKILLLEAEGKSTLALRKEKNKMFLEEAQANLEALKFMSTMIDANSTVGKAYKDLQQNADDTYTKLKAEEIKLTQEEKAENKKRADDRKAYQKERLDAARLITDLQISLMKEGTERELKENRIKYQRLIQDTLANEKLTKSEKEKLVTEYALLEAEARDKINNKDIQAEKEKQARINQVIKDAQLLRDQEQEDFDQLYRENTLSKEQLEIDAVNEKYFQLIEQAKQYGYDVAELEKRQKEELEKINDEARAKELAKEQALKQAKLDLVSGGLDATKNLIDAFAGKSEASQKRAFQAQKAISIAQAVMDTYKGANAIFASAAANPSTVLFPAQPFITAGIAIAAGIANVKKIASTQFGGGTPSPSGGSAPSAPSTSTQAATPNVSLFGQNNNANNLTSPQSEENTNQQMVVKAVVVESDITNAQTKANKYQNLASL